MSISIKPIVAVTMGDPCGIGPQIVAKAMAENQIYGWCQPIVVGNAWALQESLRMIGAAIPIQEVTDEEIPENSCEAIPIIDIKNLNPTDITIGQISPTCAGAAMEWVSKAASLAIAGKVQAIATAPVNKEAASLAGYKAIGHMELLQEITGSASVATMLMSGSLKVVHLTTHRSLREACDYVTKDRVLSSLELTAKAFAQYGMCSPRIAVAALNPHGSDGGLLGKEETTDIAPAVIEAQLKGIDASGPIPADIVFHQAIRGQFDVVLAMYHDQGHIPIKVHGFERSISVTMGLPFVRTSVDHGTAFDIAGTNKADHQSMVESIRISASLCKGMGLSNNLVPRETSTT